jgi:hypothetical protein
MSLYDIAVPAYLQILQSLQGLLVKAESHAVARNIPPQDLLDARLYPDMLPLTRQVQMVCDFATKGCARLTQGEIPAVPNTEASFAELRQRLQNAVTYVNAFSREQFAGAESRDITIPIGPDKTMTFQGTNFLVNFNLPNFYFHAATAHGILRSRGVEIGKRDFMGLA